MRPGNSKESLKFVSYAIVVLALVLIGAGLFFSGLIVKEEMVAATLPKDQVAILGAGGVKHLFKIELALTDEQMARGLMYREKLEDDAGMLFVYSRVQEIAMWMRNTKIPLDMLFIDNEGKIVHIAENARPYDERAISSRYPVRATLEIRGGQAAARGIKIGDTVQNAYFNSLPK